MLSKVLEAAILQLQAAANAAANVSNSDPFSLLSTDQQVAID